MITKIIKKGVLKVAIDLEDECPEGSTYINIPNIGVAVVITITVLWIKTIVICLK